MQACPSCGREIAGEFAFCPHCGVRLAVSGSAGERRKTVTVLFCDVTGSTALGESTDPEALRVMLARYFERMRNIVESHGGTVEKFIGDAVMAVFGVPRVHEDDALRAVRAALEMREALPELGVQARIGIDTGEVVTGTEERLATGDAVNVAARLEQAAEPGGILIGEATLALVQGAVQVEAFAPPELKGKTEPVPAHRLVALREAPERRHESLFVGRAGELVTLRQAWEQACDEQRCRLVTVVGDAGVGKSRLTAEFLAAVEAPAVHGRCLPYGEGITYWPVVEVLKQFDVLPSDPAAAAALRSLLGDTKEAASAEEIAWAFRKLLEEQAPLVCVFDDIQWGEKTFLDLVEHVALLSSGAPLLLLCLARPELAESRTDWPVELRLEPLPEAHVDELIPESLSADLRERIARTSGGNPLFVTEMVAMASEAQGEVAVPPTLKALLAARLDQLDTPERSVLERGAVEGEIFHRGAVQALSDNGQVTPRLASLVRKQLIRPDRAQLAGDDAFRFRHLLIRDAAYDALPKATRAELHERLADWLEQHGDDLLEPDEILGYHLEQACRYRDELGLPADDQLAAAARRRLTAAGRRAMARQDSGAVSLLERAVARVPPVEIDFALEIDLAGAMLATGRGDEALRRAGALSERASAAGDRVAELCGRIKEGTIRLYLEPEGAAEKLAALLDQALPVFLDAGDDLALYIGYSALGQVVSMRGQMDAAVDAFERAFAHARHAGLPHQLSLHRATGRLHGTTPASAVLSWLDEQNARGEGEYVLRLARAHALAMLGRFDEARALIAETRAGLAERGGLLMLAAATDVSTSIELLAGDPAAAVEFEEEAFRLWVELGETTMRFAAAGTLAQALYALGRLDEAEAWARRAAESDEAFPQMVSRQVRAKLLARSGDHDDAERLAREAVAGGEDTDWLNEQGDALFDLAKVLVLAGRTEDAAETFEQALDRYERKQNLAMAAQVREPLRALRASA